MLKKVGIVAAAATAAMIALSPLAFADHDDHDYDGEVTNIWIDDESEQRNQSNECEFDQEVSNSSLVPVDLLVTQDQSGSCVNTGDDAEVSEEEDEPAPAPAPAPPVVP